MRNCSELFRRYKENLDEVVAASESRCGSGYVDGEFGDLKSNKNKSFHL